VSSDIQTPRATAPKAAPATVPTGASAAVPTAGSLATSLELARSDLMCNHNFIAGEVARFAHRTLARRK